MHRTAACFPVALALVVLALCPGTARADPGNDTPETATPFNFADSLIPNRAAASARIWPDGDVDWYVFAVRERGEVALNFAGLSSLTLHSPDLGLFDSVGSLLAFTPGRTPAMEPGQIYTSVAEGTYFVRVQSLSGKGGSYNLELWGRNGGFRDGASLGPAAPPSLAVSVPEPGTAALLAAAAVLPLLTAARRRRRQAG